MDESNSPQGVEQVGKTLQDIVAELSGHPIFLFGIASMLLAIVGFIATAFVPNQPQLTWFPYALLVFGITLILLAYFLTPKQGEKLSGRVRQKNHNHDDSDVPDSNKVPQPSNIRFDPSDIFQINYQFVHPYLPLSDEGLVQMLISFSSRNDIDPSKYLSIPIHLCLILDVSGSMNTPDKYPLLREAIPHLIKAMSDDDYLTIILFSIDSDTVLLAEPISKCRLQIPNILERIDKSGVKFGNQTLLSPALKESIEEIEHFRTEFPIVVNRLYILTDGELHDAEECYSLNSRLSTLDCEINSYGFGRDFALETIKHITENIPGSGKVKPIFNTQDVQSVFSHIGKVAQKIVAQEAEFIFTFAEGVIVGDAFGYRPDRKYFGPVEHRTKTFKTDIGILELSRTYSYFFEGTVLPATSKSQEISQEVGKAILRYLQGGKWRQIETNVVVGRVDNARRCQKATQQILDIYQRLDAMRESDPESQLQALRARLAIYQREGADPALITLVKQSIRKLEQGESLTEYENRSLRTQTCTQG